MPQVDFYVLEQASETDRRQFACRLLDKLQKLEKTAVVLVPDDNSASAIDALLWEYPPESFLPHGIGPDTDSKIAIQTPGDWKLERDVAINLQLQPIRQTALCERLVEIVVQDPAVLSATRQHFKYYRQQGYQIQSHTISGT